MKKIFFLILFLNAFFLEVDAQQISDTLNKSDSLGRKQGFWIKKDIQGVVKYEGRFINDKPIGIFKYYYPDNKIKAITNFYSKQDYSRTTIFHVNGKILSLGKYYKTFKDSIWDYYNEKGQLVAVESFNKGKKDGIWKIIYSETGKTSEEVNWINDVKEGIWMQYYPDGTKKLKANNINNKIEGLWQTYYPNSRVELSGTYKASLKDGIWMYFADNGETIYKEIYTKGNFKKKDIYVKENDKMKSFETISFAYAYTQQNKTKIIFKNNTSYICDYNIDKLESMIGEEDFIKINNSTLISYSFIKGIQVYSNNVLKVITKLPSEVELVADESVSSLLLLRYKIIP